MNIMHIYHVYADGNWRDPLDEHFSALDESGLAENLGAMGIGMVGSQENREAVRDYIATEIIPNASTGLGYLAARGSLQNLTKASADDGWEQVTMQCLPSIAKGMAEGPPANGLPVIFYAHTKGAAFDGNPVHTDINHWWRRSMTYDCVMRWRECVAMLMQDYDAVGSHRIYPPDGNGYFAGNFWWARAKYVADLPDLEWGTRYHAEHWIARGDGRVFDMRPGWPDFETFAPEVMQMRGLVE